MQNQIKVYLDLALDELGTALFSLFLKDQPKFHAPEWHELGVLGHTLAATLAAKRLRAMVGINIVPAATLHDAGKIFQFSHAINEVANGKNSANAYVGHEQLSAKFARDYLNAQDCRIIVLHGLAYQARPDIIIQNLGSDTMTIKRWLALCTVDAAAKGFTSAQTQQRPIIAMKFREIAKLVRWKQNNPFLLACCQAVMEWTIPHEEVSSWIQKLKK